MGRAVAKIQWDTEKKSPWVVRSTLPEREHLHLRPKMGRRDRKISAVGKTLIIGKGLGRRPRGTFLLPMEEKVIG